MEHRICQNVLNDIDVFIAVGHWLLPESINFLDSINPGVNAYDVCDGRILIEPENRNRSTGFGGVAITVSKELPVFPVERECTDRGRVIEQFLDERRLMSVSSQMDAIGPDNSYVAHSGEQTSLIDHVVISEDKLDLVKETGILKIITFRLPSDFLKHLIIDDCL